MHLVHGAARPRLETTRRAIRVTQSHGFCLAGRRTAGIGSQRPES
jgi:hypothetical protein